MKTQLNLKNLEENDKKNNLAKLFGIKEENQLTLKQSQLHPEISNEIDIYCSEHTKSLQRSNYLCIQHDAKNLYGVQKAIEGFELDQMDHKTPLNLGFCKTSDV